MKPTANKQRAVFWDRDGTLMHEAGYCSDPANVQAIPDVAEALTALRTAGWLNIIITNQSGIGRGYYTHEDYEAVNRELFKQLDFIPDAVYYSPEAPEAASPRRKPGIGMLEEARDHFGIDLAQSWMVGDKPIDVAAGRTAGCRTILVLTGYGANASDCNPDYTIADASQAARIILTHSIDNRTGAG